MSWNGALDGADHLKVPFLVGPTASGKTSVAIEVARKIGAEIISADSRQIYSGMPIGTAQPMVEEQSRCHHHFIACMSPAETFSSGEFGRQAREKCLQLHKQGIIPFVVGGSGLYISTMVDDFFEGPAADPEIRARLKSEAETEGVELLHQRLMSVDPQSAERIMPNDFRRIERALEIYEITGKPISELRLLEGSPPPYQPLMFGLRWSREQLYERINRRCEQMLAEGLLAEVRELINGKDLNDPD
ncbi:tRNA (adenosine(37)-N6)-dimethylallyltransferase MiaA, partial [bacterium]|nr:tRNA (adenosine(37)-N6)-dimethylallyltransferase MiaA [bacterium]